MNAWISSLLDAIAKLRPDYQFIMIGPVVKIDPARCPGTRNIHYLGGKSYKELPAYMAGWDAAILPFAHNESTRFISPTKTPEYLAAGKPVVSTSITDVVRRTEFRSWFASPIHPRILLQAIEQASDSDANDHGLESTRRCCSAQNSWDLTHKRMRDLIESRILNRGTAKQRAVRGARRCCDRFPALCWATN